jgi:hypothetical protein
MIGLSKHISEAVANRKTGKYGHIDMENMDIETSSDDIATALSGCAVFYDIKNGDTKRESGILKELLKLSRKNSKPSYTVIRSRTWLDIYICDSRSEKVLKLCYDTFSDTIISVQIFAYSDEMFYTQEIFQGRTLYLGINEAKKILIDIVR